MRRTITAGLLLLILAGVAGQARQEARATQQRDSRRERECRYQWVQNGTWTAREEQLTASCVLDRWPTPGGADTFSRIISCESGWNRLAYNPNGPYVGLGQHALSSWAGRVALYRPAHWDLRARWKNSRTMLTVTARMMRDQGLSPWSCA